MGQLEILMFGRLDIRLSGESIMQRWPRKAQQLFCYLLLQHDRAHSRDVLAELIFGEGTAKQTHKGLRQVLWQVQSALASASDSSDLRGSSGAGSARLLIADANWVQLNPKMDLRVDVHQFEQAYSHLQTSSGTPLTPDEACILEQGINLYRDDLLTNWYEDWCLYERERLQNAFLVMLDRLIAHSESVGAYDHAIVYAQRILDCDHAHERTHQRVMRLHYLLGDRTSALRQFEKCASVLRHELGVTPSPATLHLLEQIRGDPLTSNVSSEAESSPSLDAFASNSNAAPASIANLAPQDPLSDVLVHLLGAQRAAAVLQYQTQLGLAAVQLAIRQRDG